jgi:aminomuconate-semialdehyde/2-hydroxymuconate-6-semialdehyde dehydrogenase
MTDVTRLTNFINGEFVAPKNGKYLAKHDPTTGRVMAEVPDSDALDVVAAIQSARQALEKWSATPARERARVLNKIADLVEANADELAAIESRDVGKPVWLARETDMARTALNFRFFAAKIMGETSLAAALDDQFVNYVLRQPVGVCALIGPWNLPLYTLTWKLAPCLAMGNTAVCKPSELTPSSMLRFAEILLEAGLPPGVCNIVCGRGETAGAALVQHPGVPLISFTGGTETGARIQAMAAPHTKKLSLELGGKNANIILKDANIEKAVAGSVRAAFLNSGQICLCGSRLLVQEEIYEKFMTEFRQATLKFKVGDPRDKDTMMGPLVSAAQLAKTVEAVEQAKKEAGRVTVGGAPPELPENLRGGYFYAPTIIEDLTNCSDLWQREIFGPVVTVVSFKYPHEAVKLANTSSYGLSASLWTADITRGHKIAAQIAAGTVWVNTWAQRDPRVPFGGVKASGMGREGGDWSLDFYSEMKTICVGV